MRIPLLIRKLLCAAFAHKWSDWLDRGVLISGIYREVSSLTPKKAMKPVDQYRYCKRCSHAEYRTIMREETVYE